VMTPADSKFLREDENDKNQEHHTQPAAGVVPPASAIRPSWQRAQKEKDQEDNQNSSQHRFSPRDGSI
jgi:hypothetical protein